MSDRLLRGAVAVLALGGAAVSAHLVAVRATGGELACTTGGCAAVQGSSYAEVFGVPVALIGLVGYLLIGTTALSSSAVAQAAGLALALSAVAFSLYLLVIQLAVIEAVCDWCLASDAITSLLAAGVLLRLRGGLRTAAGPVPETPSP